jgi:hypothetical protein
MEGQVSTGGPPVTLARTVADVLDDHVTLEVECIDRMYLNLYVPLLQREGGVANFWRLHRGYNFASSATSFATSPPRARLSAK